MTEFLGISGEGIADVCICFTAPPKLLFLSAHILLHLIICSTSLMFEIGIIMIGTAEQKKRRKYRTIIIHAIYAETETNHRSS
jgi:hypothetical protein